MLKFTILIPLLNLLPFIIGPNCLINSKNMKGKLFGLYLSLNAAIGIICFIYALFGKNNHCFYNFFQIAVFLILILIFNVDYKSRIFLISSLFVAAILVGNTFLLGIDKFNQLNFNIILIVVGIISGIRIKQLIIDSNEFNFKDFEFWMLGGFFVFSFGLIFPNCFFSVESHKKSYFLFVFYYGYQVFINLIVNLLFLKSVSLFKKYEH